MPRFVHSPRYNVAMGGHVFPTAKFGMTADALVKAGVASAADFVEPGLPAREDLLLAHTPGWVDGVLGGKLTLDDECLMELPWSKELAEAHAVAAAGTTLACRHALEDGVGLHVGGGSHHAFPDRGEGFCVFNDIACGILKALAEGRARRAAVVDLDVHQGNGTAAVFSGDDRVLTFSMHQEDIYPFPRFVPGGVDIALKAGTGDDEYLGLLEARLPGSLARHKPDLIVYQAGADVHERDLLGGLKLTFEGIRRRDEAVLGCARRLGVPVAVTLGGGYAARLDDTVRIHAGTLACAARMMMGSEADHG